MECRFPVHCCIEIISVFFKYLTVDVVAANVSDFESPFTLPHDETGKVRLIAVHAAPLLMICSSQIIFVFDIRLLVADRKLEHHTFESIGLVSL